MKKILVTITAVIMLLALTACTGGKSYEVSEYADVEVNTLVSLFFKSKEAIGSTDETNVIIQNNSDRDFTFDAVNRLEIMRDGKWCLVPAKSDAVTMQLLVLPAEGTEEFTFYFAGNYDKLEDGQYRILKSFVDADGAIAYASAEFQVGR